MMVQTDTLPSESEGPYLDQEEYLKERIKQLQKEMSTYMSMKRDEEPLSDGRRRWFNQVISDKREQIRKVMEEIERGSQQ